MPNIAFQNIRIAGIAGAVPKTKINILTDLEFVSHEDREKTVKLTGIKEYRKSTADQCTSDLCQAAAQKLLEELEIDPLTIDAILFVTQTPDYILPSSACLLQNKLGCSQDSIAFDVNLGCSGYVYGLYIACSFIQGGSLKKILLLAGDTQTKLGYEKDKNVAFLLGDAGTATLIEEAKDAPAIKMKFMTDGSRYDKLIVPAGAFRLPSQKETRTIKKQSDGGIRSDEHIYMNGMDIFNFSIIDVVKTMKNFMDIENLRVEDIDCLVLHQANKFMTDKIAKKLSFPSEKILYSLDVYGNTSSASIPITIASCFSRLGTSGTQHCLLSGFGVGLSWGVIDIFLQDICCPPIIEI